MVNGRLCFEAPGLAFHQGDCNAMAEIDASSVDLVIAGPPYADRFDYTNDSQSTLEPTPGTQKPSRQDGLTHYLDAFECWFREVARVLKPGRYLAVNIGTVRQGKRTLALPFLVALRSPPGSAGEALKV